jgi:hypothetical protein
MSQLNLVDLAGSEKAGQTGAEGARLLLFRHTEKIDRIEECRGPVLYS